MAAGKKELSLSSRLTPMVSCELFIGQYWIQDLTLASS
jgi:hypothetical protein